MTDDTRLFYRTKDGKQQVVVQRRGLEIESYPSPEELIETHIKGLLAIDQQDSKRVRELLRKYRPGDSIRS